MSHLPFGGDGQDIPASDPAPIRGRWTLATVDGRPQNPRAVHEGPARGGFYPPGVVPVEVVPVPDEAAIERGNAEREASRRLGKSHTEAFRAGLRAALETPDGQ